LKKKHWFIAVGFFVMAIYYYNSVVPPEAVIRKRMLWGTPIGTDMSDVIQYVEKHRKWELLHISHEEGYLDYETVETIGVQEVRAYIGHYYNPFEVVAEVYWGFDENSKLVDVYVRKCIDAL